MKSKVYVKFPKAGLGNKLLTWSRGYVFATLNDLELHTSSWLSFFWGAWFRREKKKRIYISYFKKKSFITSLRYSLYRMMFKNVSEPDIEKCKVLPSKTLFVFDKTFREYDFFKEVRPYKTLVKKGLFDLLAPSVEEAYHRAEKPIIGIHIRRGDFKIANPITELDFFIEVITEIRNKVGRNIPVTVFTDADRDEVQQILDLPNTKLAEPNPDIVDILLLADSQILMISISSTFSYWAGFLTEGIVIKHPKEWQAPLCIDAGGREFIWDKESFFTDKMIRRLESIKY